MILQINTALLTATRHSVLVIEQSHEELQVRGKPLRFKAVSAFETKTSLSLGFQGLCLY